jgi:hypothetical protein
VLPIDIRKTRWLATSLNVLRRGIRTSGLLKVVMTVRRKLSDMVGVVTRTILNITTKIGAQISGHAWDVTSPWIRIHLNTGLVLDSGSLWARTR